MLAARDALTWLATALTPVAPLPPQTPPTAAERPAQPSSRESLPAGAESAAAQPHAIPATEDSPDAPDALDAPDAPGAPGAPPTAAPQWIWSAPLTGADAESAKDKEVWLLREFEVRAAPPPRATLWATGDDRLELWLNGTPVVHSQHWQEVVVDDVTPHIRAGRNVLAARGRNDAGPAGVAVRLLLAASADGGAALEVVSDGSWRAARREPLGWPAAAGGEPGFAAAAVELGEVGAAHLPWSSEVGAAAFGCEEQSPPPQRAAPAAGLTLRAGFAAELLYRVPRRAQGSWVALAAGPGGALFASDEQGNGLFRIAPAARGDAEAVTVVSRVAVPLSGAQGLLWAFDSLYAVVNGRDDSDSGLYRARDTDADGELDRVELLAALHGHGEHGPHGLALSPDGRGLLLAAGNATALPVERLGRTRIPPCWGEDLLLPRQWDARGHARGRLAPGGWIARVDPDGERFELLAIGMRNQYDVAVDRDGEVFTWDADMEWDMGMPWYRPTRICHVVSGAEFGWRAGSGKWPDYYPDSLPPAIDLGPGSPTGLVFGTGAAFPERYQRALFALDWTFGTILAVHLEPRGASYGGEVEELLSGSPLPVTDAAIGGDGHLYFTVGGRGLQSALYRVWWQGEGQQAAVRSASDGSDGSDGSDANNANNANNASNVSGGSDASNVAGGGDSSNASGASNAADAGDSVGARAPSAPGPAAGDASAALPPPERALRRRLEADHGVVREGAVADAWPHLNHPDRFVRYAARLAIEAQPVERWAACALAEREPLAASLALVALARRGRRELQPKLLEALARLPLEEADTAVQLAALRAYALAFVRMGAPDAATARRVAARLDALYPAPDRPQLDAELVQLLVYLQAPSVLAETMPRLAEPHSEPPPPWGARILRNGEYGGPIARMLENMPPVRQLHYAFVLRNVRAGWTPPWREQYFRFLQTAARYAGGESYQGFLRNIRVEALAGCTDEERASLAGILGSQAAGRRPPPPAVAPAGPPRSWTVADAVEAVSARLADRDYERGRALFYAAACAACHRFDGEGGNVGPDLTTAGNKFSVEDLLEATIEPSRAISDQYASSVVHKRDGSSLFGRAVQRGDGVVEVYLPAPGAPPLEVPASEVEKITTSPLSQMPPGLANAWNAEELADLVAFVLSRADPDDPMFRH